VPFTPADPIPPDPARSPERVGGDRPSLTFTVVDPRAAEAMSLLTRFFADIVSRYWGRPATSEEVARAMSDEPSDDLQGETGYLVLARSPAGVLGCAGVRVVAPGVGEVTRVFLDPAARGSGAARALLGELETIAADRGLHRLRLTVREDLVEARRLYERAGYVPVEPFSTSPYADHFLGKTVSPA
jgi:GNAT superfamily N-acetyltransferase